MINRNKLISELENGVYSNEDKYKADNIVAKYINLLNGANFEDYKLSWKFSNNVFLVIKHKAFHNKVYAYFIGHKLFIENKEIENFKDFNDILPTFFIITLDKKDE